MNNLKLEDIEIPVEKLVRFELTSEQLMRMVEQNLLGIGCKEITMVLSNNKISGKYIKPAIVVGTESGLRFTVNHKKKVKLTPKGLQAALRWMLSDGEAHLIGNLHRRINAETFTELKWGKKGSVMAARKFPTIPIEQVHFTLRHNIDEVEQKGNTKWQLKKS